MASYATARDDQGTSADDLTRALAHFRAQLDRALPLAERAENFWAVVVAVRELAAADVLRDELIDFAHSTGLLRDLGRVGADDVAHLIRWGLLKRWPFGQRRGTA